MFASKKLKPVPCIIKNSELTPDGVARDLETLKRNELIAGDERIAQRVFESSVTHTYKRGDQIIEEGEDKDDVFFLLLGNVSIRKEGRGEIDVLSAPITVGELAADMPEKPRSASVVVSSDTVRARVVSGSEFRSIRDSNSDFANAFRRLIGNMNQRKIAQTAQRTEPNQIVKAAKPLGTWIVSFILAISLIVNFASLSWGQSLSLSALTAFLAAILSMYFDHRHRYGRLFSITLFSTLTYLIYFGASWVVFVDGRSLPIPFLWNFSSSPDQSPAMVVAIFFSLLLLCVVCAVADHLRNSAGE